MRWLTALKRRLFPSPTPHGDDRPEVNHVDYHPAHEGETPDDLHRGRHRIKETFTPGPVVTTENAPVESPSPPI